MGFTPLRLLARYFRRQLIAGVVEPSIPFRRHAAGFFLAFIHDPALFAAIIGPALGATTATAVIAVPGLVTANPLAENPCVENGASNHKITLETSF